MSWLVVYERARRKDGSLMFPERLSEDFLDKVRRSQGSYIYANQYQNEVIPLEEQRFKQEWFKYFEELPRIKNTFAFIDPAISQKQNADYCGIVVVHRDVAGNDYVDFAQQIKLTPTALVEMVFKINERYKPQAFGIEKIAFQEVLIYMVSEEMRKRKVSLPIVGINHGPTERKELRISSLVPKFEWGTIYLRRGLVDLEEQLLKFPRGAHDDICFVGNTLVATKKGPVQISKLQIGDMVLTPIGYKRVVAKNKRKAEVISRIGLRGTADHPIATYNGLVPMGSLTQCRDCVEFSLCLLIKTILPKLLYSKKENSDLWGREDIISKLKGQQINLVKALRVCMLQYMNTSQEKRFLLGITFITKIMITSIIATKIWSVYQLANIAKNQKTWIEKRFSKILVTFAHWLQHGIDQKQEENGTSTMLKKFGKRCLIKNLFVRFVKNNFKQNALDQLDSAQTNVEKNLEEVYCIKVEQAGLFFANNVLVSNCDALSSIDKIAFPPVEEKPDETPPNPADAEAYEQWYRRTLSRRANQPNYDE